MTSGGADFPEQRLWRAAGRGFELLFQAAAGHAVVRQPGGLLALTGVAAPDLNCGVVWAEDDAASLTRMFADELRSRGLPGILLVADEAGQTDKNALPAAGLVAAARMPLMTRGPGPVEADARFRVRGAKSSADLSVANRLIAAAFELSATAVDAAFGPALLESAVVAVELVEEGSEPVGSLQTTSHDGLVGIWSMATPPARRRRGIARAGLAHVVSSQLTNKLAFLIATEAGRPLYDAVGFRAVAWSTAWVVPPRDAGS